MVGFSFSIGLKAVFEQGVDLEVIGLKLTEDESYIMKCRYLAAEYRTYPYDWDPEYPCKDKWCPEDIETILQCDIVDSKRRKLKEHNK